MKEINEMKETNEMNEMNEKEELMEILKAMKPAENHFHAPIYNYGTISGPVIKPVYNNCGKPKEEKGAPGNDDWKVMQSSEAKKLWQLLTVNGYCQVKGQMFHWTKTQAEYGYMVHIVSDLLHLRHPTSGRLQWRAFQLVFDNAADMEGVAKASVSNNISGIGNSKAWCEEAKALKNLLRP